MPRYSHTYDNLGLNDNHTQGQDESTMSPRHAAHRRFLRTHYFAMEERISRRKHKPLRLPLTRLV